MTHRSRHKSPAIPVGCYEVHHHDEEDYKEDYAGRRYHLVRMWPYSYFDESYMAGSVPDHKNPAVAAHGRTLSLKDPGRMAARGGQTVLLECPCGQNKQPNNKELLEITRRLIQEFGSEAVIDIGRL